MMVNDVAEVNEKFPGKNGDESSNEMRRWEVWAFISKHEKYMKMFPAQVSSSLTWVQSATLYQKSEKCRQTKLSGWRNISKLVQSTATAPMGRIHQNRDVHYEKANKKKVRNYKAMQRVGSHSKLTIFSPSEQGQKVRNETHGCDSVSEKLVVRTLENWKMMNNSHAKF